MSVHLDDAQSAYAQDVLQAFVAAYFGQERQVIALNGPGGAGKTTATCAALRLIREWLAERCVELAARQEERARQGGRDFVPVEDVFALADDSDPRWQIIQMSREDRAKQRRQKREAAADQEFETAVSASFEGGIDDLEL